jgi:hypothetical protein
MVLKPGVSKRRGVPEATSVAVKHARDAPADEQHLDGRGEGRSARRRWRGARWTSSVTGEYILVEPCPLDSS